jgi:4'-phosphopantetheinyl transferase
MADGESVWRRPDGDVTLADGEIHVWRAALDVAPERLGALARTLAPDEEARAQRFHFERDARWYIAGRGILRALLGRYLGVAPGDVRLVYGEHGKPALDGAGAHGSRLRFNATHAQGLALYALAAGAEVGIDVERLRHVDDAERIVERYFAPAEREALRALAMEERDEGFLRCWTRKEAYLKAVGAGLGWPLDQFAVSLDAAEPARLLHVTGDAAEAARWSLWSLDPAPGFVGALAARVRGWRVRYWEWVG